MDTYEYGELLKTLTVKIENIKNIVKPVLLQTRLEEIDQLQQNPTFWEDAQNASKISQEKRQKD